MKRPLNYDPKRVIPTPKETYDTGVDIAFVRLLLFVTLAAFVLTAILT